jgi:predicted Zn-dependent protease
MKRITTVTAVFGLLVLLAVNGAGPAGAAGRPAAGTAPSGSTEVLDSGGRQWLAFLDELNKALEEGSKERKILEGATKLLGASKEVDYRTERTLGESLALEGFKRYGLPVDNDRLQEYVNLVGMGVARNSQRPTIPYRFVVVESSLQNAFSCPGGIVFLSSALVKTCRDESQLANILAHEVAHVGYKHAMQTLRRARALEGIGQIGEAAMGGEEGRKFAAAIGDLENTLFEKGLDQNMEYEADLRAMETAYRTGYDPVGMLEVLESLQARQAGASRSGSWYGTHPPLNSRIAKCRNRLAHYPDHDELARQKDRFQRYKALIP